MLSVQGVIKLNTFPKILNITLINKVHKVQWLSWFFFYCQSLQDGCHCFWPKGSGNADMDGAEEVYGKLTVTLKRAKFLW